MKKRPPKGVKLETLNRLMSYGDHFSGLYQRSEQRHWAKKYLVGLIMEGERKSVEPMAARIPGGDVQSLQQFIGQSTWGWEAVQERYRDKMLNKVGKDGCVLVVDDTCFLKKGKHSVGVQRQYSGMIGGTANCQSAVSCYCAKGNIGFPTGMRLYLPESWSSDEKRCRRAGVPSEVRFKFKWKMALDLIDEALASGIKAEAVVADSGYGNSKEFRFGLEERNIPYIVGIPSDMVLWRAGVITREIPPRREKGSGLQRKAYLMNERPREAKDLIDEGQWRLVKWRKGSKGWLSAKFQAIRVEWAAKKYRRGGFLYKDPTPYWLLIKKENDGELRYYLSNFPENTSLRELVKVAHTRWTIELSYQQMKEELGLDHFEGRGWLGWHHHVTMVMLAYGFLMEERLRRKKKTDICPSLRFVEY